MFGFSVYSGFKMKYLVRVGLITLLLLAEATGEAATEKKQQEEAKVLLEKTIGDLGCYQGCVKRPK